MIKGHIAHPDKLPVNRNLGMRNNVTFNVIDTVTGRLVEQHVGHNTATNTLLVGIGHYLVGDGVFNQGYSMLSRYVPRYISLGTMGLYGQDEDEEGLPACVGVVEDLSKYSDELSVAQAAVDVAKADLDSVVCKHYYDDDYCRNECLNAEHRALIVEKENAYNAALEAYNDVLKKARDVAEEVAFAEYMKQRPGYGADGYDMNQNNNRKMAGLGWPFTSYDMTADYEVGSLATYQGKLYSSLKKTSVNADLNQYIPWNADNWKLLDIEDQPTFFELITPSFPRAEISYRDVVPEVEAELPKTIDVVFSAMISTGALAQFRGTDRDYVFITEAGLWSRRDYVQDGVGTNGLLAAYRIAPPDEKNWYMVAKNVPDSHAQEYMTEHPDVTDIDQAKDLVARANRKILKQNVLKVGKNQVVQVVWKIQLGSIDQFAQMDDLRYQYYDIPKEEEG